jgi:hypothetical protein
VIGAHQPIPLDPSVIHLRLTLDIASRMVAAVSRKKLSTTVYITPEQDALLKQLHARTKVPVAEYIRQGIDLVLEKYREQLPGQATLRFDDES